jgi:type II secretory pathway pseudopilin PulG
MNKADKRYGFTIIELMLAMGFVATLLIAISMTVIQIGNIYNRGLTLKEVNQAGRLISSELQRNIAMTTPFDVSSGDGSQYVKKKVDVRNYYINNYWGGRLCLNQYSFIWNYGKDIQANLNNINSDSNLNIYRDNTTTDLNETDIPIRFIKVYDPDAKYCVSDPVTNKYIDIDTTESIELLDESQHNLAIHSFKIITSITAADPKTGQQLYNIEFVLGTNLGNTLISSNTECKPPSETGLDFSYCSVNKFNIVARAGNAIQ